LSASAWICCSICSSSASGCCCICSICGLAASASYCSVTWLTVISEPFTVAAEDGSPPPQATSTPAINRARVDFMVRCEAGTTRSDQLEYDYDQCRCQCRWQICGRDTAL